MRGLIGGIINQVRIT